MTQIKIRTHTVTEDGVGYEYHEYVVYSGNNTLGVFGRMKDAQEYIIQYETEQQLLRN